MFSTEDVSSNVHAIIMSIVSEIKHRIQTNSYSKKNDYQPPSFLEVIEKIFNEVDLVSSCAKEMKEDRDIKEDLNAAFKQLPAIDIEYIVHALAKYDKDFFDSEEFVHLLIAKIIELKYLPVIDNSTIRLLNQCAHVTSNSLLTALINPMNNRIHFPRGCQTDAEIQKFYQSVPFNFKDADSSPIDERLIPIFKNSSYPWVIPSLALNRELHRYYYRCIMILLFIYSLLIFLHLFVNFHRNHNTDFDIFQFCSPAEIVAIIWIITRDLNKLESNQKLSQFYSNILIKLLKPPNSKQIYSQEVFCLIMVIHEFLELSSLSLGEKIALAQEVTHLVISQFSSLIKIPNANNFNQHNNQRNHNNKENFHFNEKFSSVFVEILSIYAALVAQSDNPLLCIKKYEKIFQKNSNSNQNNQNSNIQNYNQNNNQNNRTNVNRNNPNSKTEGSWKRVDNTNNINNANYNNVKINAMSTFFHTLTKMRHRIMVLNFIW